MHPARTRHREPDKSLSDQLSRDNGVIKPPPNGDAEIHTKVANPDPGVMTVIPHSARQGDQIVATTRQARPAPA